MVYCTKDDLFLLATREKIGNQADDSGKKDPDCADATLVITRAIASAEAAVNEAMNGRYTVPVVGTIPARVRDLTARFAAMLLAARRREYINEFGKLPYDEVKKDLDAIRRGEQDVPGLSAATATLSATTATDTSAYASF